MPISRTLKETSNSSQRKAPSHNTREVRNIAEKARRDRLNGYIHDLAKLVPMVADCPKKLDKTSILRLAVTYLRMNGMLPATINQNIRIPPFLRDKVDWIHHLQSSTVDGDLLVVTSIGKIVFLTNTIEKILGYTQTELLGLSLFTITALEDHDQLRRALTPDDINVDTTDSIGELEDLKVTSSEPITNPGSSRSYTTSRSSVCRASSSSHDPSDQPMEYYRQPRLLFIRVCHRNPRSEKPVYELVRIQGYLKVPKIFVSEVQKKCRKNKVDVPASADKGIVLVAIMERLPNQRVTELSMLEPSKDEYVTRHTLEGQILYSDQRISTVAGYLSDEVNGFQAFNFMHPDDSPWVALALFQMFAKGEAFGLSCYRLQAKNGTHIYLKSYGYLEYNSNTETFGSFICVNSMVTEDEGERAIAEMKNRHRPLLEPKDENEKAIPVPLRDLVQNGGLTVSNIHTFVRGLISQVGELKKVTEDPEKMNLQQYQIAKLFSQRIPPPQFQLETIAQNSPASLSLPSPSTPSSPPQLPTPKQEHHWSSTSSAGSPPAIPCCQVTQDRPSVLRIAPARNPVTVYPVDNNISSSTICSRTTSTSCNGTTEYSDCGISSSATAKSCAADATDEQRSYSSCDDCKTNQIIKPEFIKLEDDANFDGIADAYARTAPIGGAKSDGMDTKCAKNGTITAPEPISCDRIGVVVQRGARAAEKCVASNGVDGRNCAKRAHGFVPDTSVPTPRKRFKDELFKEEVSDVTSVTQYSDSSQFQMASLHVSAFAPGANNVERDPSQTEFIPNYSDLVGVENESGVGPFDSFYHHPKEENRCSFTLEDEFDEAIERPDFQPMNLEELDLNHSKVESNLHLQKSQLATLAHKFPNYRDKVNQLQHERKTQGQYLQSMQRTLHRL